MGCDGGGGGCQAARRGKGGLPFTQTQSRRALYIQVNSSHLSHLKVTTTNTTQLNSWGEETKKEDGGHRAKHSRQPTASTTALDLLYTVKIFCSRPDMKLNLLATTVILFVAFLPRRECRAIESPVGAPRPNFQQVEQKQQQQQQQQQHRSPSGPILERLGEEYFIRLGNGDSNSFPPSSMYPLGASGLLNRALKLQLTRRLLQGKAGNLRGGFKNDDDGDSVERGRRSEDPPISLDLTFHLLREMMEMSKAEQLAQQAQNNRRMMELFGK